MASEYQNNCTAYSQHLQCQHQQCALSAIMEEGQGGIIVQMRRHKQCHDL